MRFPSLKMRHPQIVLRRLLRLPCTLSFQEDFPFDPEDLSHLSEHRYYAQCSDQKGRYTFLTMIKSSPLSAPIRSRKEETSSTVQPSLQSFYVLFQKYSRSSYKFHLVALWKLYQKIHYMGFLYKMLYNTYITVTRFLWEIKT